MPLWTQQPQEFCFAPLHPLPQACFSLLAHSLYTHQWESCASCDCLNKALLLYFVLFLQDSFHEKADSCLLHAGEALTVAAAKWLIPATAGRQHSSPSPAWEKRAVCMVLWESPVHFCCCVLRVQSSTWVTAGECEVCTFLTIYSLGSLLDKSTGAGLCKRNCWESLGGTKAGK